MAEQKIEDTKSPVARRAVRPFVGPATSGSGAPTARPALRPAGPAGPAGRPNPAPFAPRLASPGASAPAAQSAALGTSPVAEAAETPALPVLRPTTLAPTFDLTVAAPTPVASAALEMPEPQIDLAAEVSPDLIAATDFGFEPGPMPTEMAATDVIPVPSVEAAPRRPVTSEMVAIDAYAAFDSVWGPSNTPQASPVVEAVAPAASPVDEMSLGGGVDGPHVWTDEIMVPPDVAALAAHDASDASDSADAHGEPGDTAWSRVATPDSAIPAWLLDDPSGVHTPTAPHQSEALASIDSQTQPEAELLPLPHADESDTPSHSVFAAQMHETVAIVPDVPVVDEAVSRRTAHGLRVSATLDRLAKRVRAGEIDVSSVAPEAPDAAVLASVLAALLGGSSSR